VFVHKIDPSSPLSGAVVVGDIITSVEMQSIMGRFTLLFALITLASVKHYLLCLCYHTLTLYSFIPFSGVPLASVMQMLMNLNMAQQFSIGRWCECSCDVHVCSLHSTQANLAISMQNVYTPQAC
jgi:hypothetical protein